MVFGIPSPSLAKVDAHCDTACSLAPAHTIIMKSVINNFEDMSSFMLIPFSFSSIRGVIGTFVNTIALAIGTIAHITAVIRQFEIVNRLKNSVLRSTTST